MSLSRPFVVYALILLLLSLNSAEAQPVNDDCSSATLILLSPGPNQTFDFDLTGAQDTPGLPCSSAVDVWFRFDAAVSTLIGAFADGGSFQDLSLYRDPSVGMGMCPPVSDLVECSEFGSLVAPVVAGESYYIRVAGPSSGVGSVGELRVVPWLDDRYTLRLEEVQAGAGQTVDLGVCLDGQSGTLGSPELIDGWTIGVCHERPALSLTAAAEAPLISTINGGAPAFFSSLTLLEEGFIGVVLIDLLAQQQFLPVLDQRLYDLTYSAAGNPGDEFTVQVCDDLGSSELPGSLLSIGLERRLVARIDGGIAIAPNLKRGDCNNDGNFDIGDAVYASDYLFPPPGVPLPPIACFDACDGNDDGVFDISDMIAMLNALFAMTGESLPAPGVCGPDPTPDSLPCPDFDSCP